MGLAHVTDHETQALARLVVQYADKPNVQALVGVGAASVQTAEDVLWALFSERLLDGAVGAQLDNLGAVVGQAREASTDDQYRARIRGRILANRSDNTVEALIGIARAVVDDADLVAALSVLPPAAFILELQGVAVSDDTAGALADMIRDARAAGIGGVLEYSSSPADDTLTFPTVIGFLSVAASATDNVVTVVDSSPLPALGTIVIGRGTVDEEQIDYLYKSGNDLVLDGILGNNHEVGDVVELDDQGHTGLGDDTDAAIGGVFASALEA